MAQEHGALPKFEVLLLMGDILHNLKPWGLEFRGKPETLTVIFLQSFSGVFGGKPCHLY